jgi:hypothetical protein
MTEEWRPRRVTSRRKVVAMTFYGDPCELERLGRQVREHAQEVRDRAGRARSAAHAARWHSVARERFIAEVEDRMSHLEGAARRLDEAADRLDEQARAVREALALIRAAQAAVLGWIHDAKAEVERAAASGLTAVVVAGVELASVLVPGSTGLRIPALPSPGDRDWLQVADELRRGGVRL